MDIFLQLLTIFVSGKLEQYEDFYAKHKEFVTSIGRNNSIAKPLLGDCVFVRG